MPVRDEIEAVLSAIRSYGHIDISVDYDGDLPSVSSDYDGEVCCDDLGEVLAKCREIESDLADLPQDHVAWVRTLPEPCDPRHINFSEEPDF